MTHPKIVYCAAIATGVFLILATGASIAQRPIPHPGGPVAPARPAAAPHDFDKWEKEIAAYETADRADPPRRGGVLFIGSSTIRMWKTLARDFPNHNVVNRGFGGSEIADSTHFASRVVFPYEPRQIFLRAGGNDIHAGRPPDEVSADFVAFVRKVRERLPNSEIVYIAVNPAPARWSETNQYHVLNTMIRKLARRMPRVKYLDAYNISLTPDGQARAELFIADKLHFNADGYKLLAERVRPYLAPVR